MQNKNGFSQQEIINTIHNLRLKLSETYVTDGHTDEVVKISQELDRYIVFAQERLIEDKNLVLSNKMAL